MGVINTLELEGVSDKSWGDAAREALREAGKTIRHINRMEVLGTSTSVAAACPPAAPSTARTYGWSESIRLES